MIASQGRWSRFLSSFFYGRKQLQGKPMGFIQGFDQGFEQNGDSLKPPNNSSRLSFRNPRSNEDLLVMGF